MGFFDPFDEDLQTFDVHEVGGVPHFFVEFGQMFDAGAQLVHFLKIFHLRQYQMQIQSDFLVLFLTAIYNFA